MHSAHEIRAILAAITMLPSDARLRLVRIILPEGLTVAPADALDAIWHDINALGGSYEPGNWAAMARDEALADCLAVVERHGGHDPFAGRAA